MSAIDKIKAKAKSKVMHIVLPEGTEPRTVQATRKITDQGIAKVTLLGNVNEVKKVAAETGTDLTGVDIIDPKTSEKSAGYADLLYELRKAKGMTPEQAAELVVEAGAMDVLVADTPAKMKDAWAARSSFLEGIEEQTKLLDECDVVVPVSKIADFVLYIKEIDKEFDFEVKMFGHAGDGNLHVYTCSVDMEMDAFVKQVDQFMRKLYAKTTELGGQISGEHGIGMGKVEYLAESVGPVNMRLMEEIKKVFDPKMILNPGKVCYTL